MCRVLITHSYFLQFDPKQQKAGRPYPPLGTLYAAAALRQSGCEVRLFDPMFARSTDEIQPLLEEFHPQFMVICDDGFNYLTKMCLTNMRQAAFRLAAAAQAVGCPVITSSSDASDNLETYLENGSNAVIIGEVEGTLCEAIQALVSGGFAALGAVEGMAFRGSDGKIRRTAARPPMRTLDDLPLPAWDLVNIEPYRAAWLKSSGKFSLNAVTTRGCPFKCNWCAKPIYGNRYAVRSARGVVEELTYLQGLFGFDHIWFCDDIFGLTPGWAAQFADEVERAGLHFRFTIQARADLLLKHNAIADLRRAGCEWIWIGAESGSQKILHAMDKGITVGQIRQVTDEARKHGVRIAFFLQFGYTGETAADIAATIRLVLDCKPDDIGVSISYPLPGTVFYERVRTAMGSRSNWTDSDELLLMFPGKFSPRFYKLLHRHVHFRFRLGQALEEWKHLFRPRGRRDFRRAIAGGFYAAGAAASAVGLRFLSRKTSETG